MVELLVGLGNPGPGHELNRHNVGFLVLDTFEPELHDGFGGRVGRGRVGGREIVFLKPNTFMNRSGLAVAAAMRHLRIDLEQVLVVHDDLDLPFGVVRLKRGGGTGGHNGLRSIVASCGGDRFDRLRVGIGRPPAGSVVDWVLGDFTESEGAGLDSVLSAATRAVAAAVGDGTDVAMNTVNARARD